jgi:hypothetical protein
MEGDEKREWRRAGDEKRNCGCWLVDHPHRAHNPLIGVCTKGCFGKAPGIQNRGLWGTSPSRGCLDFRVLATQERGMGLGPGPLGKSSEAACRLGFRPMGTERKRLALDARPLGVSLNNRHEFGVLSEL